MIKRILPPKKATLRSVLLVIHLWLGVIIGLYFSAVGATGSVLVFRNEIDGRERPETVFVAPPKSGARPLSLTAVVDGLHAAYPQAKPTDFSTIMMPQAPGGAYSVTLSQNGAAAMTLTIDPYDGHVLRQASSDGKVMSWIRDLHIHLLQKASGEVANGYASLFAAILLLSGLYLWWPSTIRRIRQALTIKRLASLKRFLHDLHNVTGFYTLLVLFVVTLTGTALVFNDEVQGVVYRWAGAPVRPGSHPIVVPDGARRLSLDALVAAAQAAVPDGKIRFLTAPTKPRQPFYAMFDTTRNRFLPYASVYIDPYTGKVQRLERDDSSTAGQIIMRQMAVLHFGEWGGLPSKILYALVGLAPLVLYVTGLWMYLQKRFAKAAIVRRRQSGGKTVKVTK